MHSEPSKAAMERAKELIGGGLTFSTFARYIDTVDRVAREVKAGIPGAISLHPLLHDLMLPDELDAKLELRMALSKHLSAHDDIIAAVDDQLTALTAAGYTITKGAEV